MTRFYSGTLHCSSRLCFSSAIGLFVLLRAASLTYASLVGCSGDINLVLVIDSSSSLREADPPGQPLQTWYAVTNFTNLVVQALPVDGGYTRIAVVRYSTNAALVLSFDAKATSTQVYDALYRMRHVGGNTNTAAALAIATAQLARPSASTANRNVVLLFTDGLSNINPASTLTKAMTLKGAPTNAEVFVVGATEYIDEVELTSIASSPVDQYYFAVATFSKINSIIDVLTRRLCRLPDVTTPSPNRPGCVVPGCQICSTNVNTCDKCNPGMFRSGTVCTACMPQCDSCHSIDTCDACSSGAIWSVATQRCTGCEVIADIALILDTSGSIRDKNPKDQSYDNYQLLLNFVMAFIDQLNIGPDTNRVAEVHFSNFASVDFYLDTYSDKRMIKNAVNATPYLGISTNTSGALRLARTEIFRAGRGDRPYVPNIGIIITDGESTDDQSFTVPEAEMMHYHNVTMFAIGVTDQINNAELTAIASLPTATHFFNLTNYANIASILHDLEMSVCASTNVITQQASRLDLQINGNQNLRRRRRRR